MAGPTDTPTANRWQFIRRNWRNIREAGPRRLATTAVFLILALLLARFGWEIAVLDNAERGFFDIREIVAAPEIEQDDRILMVVYDDETLIAARKRSPLDRGLLADALRNLDEMGAKAIGVDMLFDQPQDEDEELISVLRSMKTPSFVGYTDIEGNSNDIVFAQQQFLDEFMGRLRGSAVSPVSVALHNDNGVVRRWPDQPPSQPTLLARAMAATGEQRPAMAKSDYEGSIRYREPVNIERPVFTQLRIDLFADPEIAPMMAGQVAGRYVLIGGDIVDTDRAVTPLSVATGTTMPGMEVHAHMLAQLLDRAELQQPLSASLWALAMLVVVCGGLTGLLELRFRSLFPFLVVQLAVFGGLPILMQSEGIDTIDLPAAGWAVGWVVAFAAVGSAARAANSEQRKFAQAALGKYLPRDIALEIIDKPELLALGGEKRKIYVLFSDLEGFTKLSHAIPPEMVAELLNRYLDMLTQVVLDHGGVLDKYVGDAVVAFWGAPIARPDDAMNAARAGYALWQAGEEFRRNVPEGVPPIGKTRVGLHYGDAVVGNFGGERRIQYTALGDSMNTAARLEAANKALDSSVMASREFAERSGLDWWRPMGKIVLRGRATPVELFEPAPDFPSEDKDKLSDALQKFDTNRGKSIEMISALAAKYPADKSLDNLVSRLERADTGGVYVLG